VGEDHYSLTDWIFTEMGDGGWDLQDGYEPPYGKVMIYKFTRMIDAVRFLLLH
jgi:hypothetical protein